MSKIPVLLLFIFVILFSAWGVAQSPPASDPQAVTFAARSMAAMSGGASISDVTLTGSVVWNGSETGTATLKAMGPGESRTEVSLSTGTRTDVRDAQTGTARGQWINPDRSSGKYAFHNCHTDAVWFFPVFSSLAGRTNVVLKYIGVETRNARRVQHIQSYVYAGSSPRADQPTPEQLSTTDFYLDATSLLPMAVVFNVHPDNNSLSNLVSEVEFSDYQPQGTVNVPSHIQRFLQGALVLDFTVSSVAINSGLTLSTFQIN